jgi:hypothetical protein
MYNLFVSGRDDNWQGKPWELEKGRIGEFTADPLLKHFGKLDDERVAQLLTYPCIFAFETAVKQPARVGWLTRVRHRQKEALIEYEFEEAVPPIPPERILEIQWDLDVTDWEMNRTHWALKDVDLFPVLIEAGLLPPDVAAAQGPQSKMATLGFNRGSDVDARPLIFRLPTKKRDPDLVSVMMPFDPGFDDVFLAIHEACKAAGFKCERADNVWESSEIMQDIFTLIYRSQHVVCDFTNQNANVFYETGIAHTLGRTVIPIAQHPEHVPFDLRHHRFIRYLDNAEGRGVLTHAVANRLKTLRVL